MTSTTHESAGSAVGSALPPPRAPRARLSEADHRRLRRGLRLRRESTAWVFLAPAVLFFTLFLLLPALSVFWWSLRKGGITGESSFVGLQNWLTLAGQSQVVTSLANTVKFALMSILPIIVLSMVIALLLQRIKRGGAAFRFLVYFPVLVPGVVAGLIWIFMTHPDFGLLNLTLQALGLPTQIWLGPGTALPVLAGIDVWRSVGYWAIFLLAALLGLPRELYEAAHLDGANAWQRFWRITFPQIRPIVLFVLVMSTIWALQIFDTVWVLTRGGPGTSTLSLVYFVYRDVFSSNEVGYAAAISVTLLVGVLLLTLLEMRVLRTRGAS